MKKLLTLGLSCACLMTAALALGGHKSVELKETGEDILNEVNPAISLRKAAIGSEETAYSKTFSQYGVTDDGLYVLRFATAVKGNITKLSYLRTIPGLTEETKEVKVESVYAGISSGDKSYYYDGTDLTTDQTKSGEYYWACYSVIFETDTYKNADITAKLIVETEAGEKVESESKSTSLNKEIEAEKPVEKAPFTVTLGGGSGAWERVNITWTDDAYDLATEINTSNISVKVTKPDGGEISFSHYLDTCVVNNDTNSIVFGAAFGSAEFGSLACTWNIQLTSLSNDKVFEVSFAAAKTEGKYEISDVKVTEKLLVSYNISFDSDGGSTCESQKAVVGKTYGTLPTPTKEGYSFDGWYLEDTLITAATIVDLTEDVTLVAKWAEKRVFDVKLGGGSGAWERVNITWTDDAYDLATEINTSNISVKVTKPDGGEISFSHYLDTCVVNNDTNSIVFGAAFGSAEFGALACTWNIQLTSLTKEKVFEISFTATKTGSEYLLTNLKTKETKLTSYTVSFDSDGGSACASQNAVVGKTFGELPEPTKEGYSFDGWYLGDTLITSSTIVELTEDVTLVAKWVAPRLYTVVLGGGGGAWERFTITWTDDAYDLNTAINKDNIQVKVTRATGGEIAFVNFLDRQEVLNDQNTIIFGASFADASFRGATCNYEVSLTGLDGVVRKVSFTATESGGSYTISNYSFA